jgi:hypothetical protein
MTLTIAHDGTVKTIYDDRLLPLIADLGGGATTRASSVEPTGDGRWVADLFHVGGPVLPPTQTRAESLDAERKWLEDNYL